MKDCPTCPVPLVREGGPFKRWVHESQAMAIVKGCPKALGRDKERKALALAGAAR